MRPIPVVLLLCAILLLGGCGTPAKHPSQAGAPYVVNADRALFYSYGPAQTTGPDFALKHGQAVKMMNYDYGYSRIAIEGTGQVGYVPTDDLMPQPAPGRSSPSPSPGASKRRHNTAEAFWNRPPTAAEQSSVPLPEFPETEPRPGSPPFRY